MNGNELATIIEAVLFVANGAVSLDDLQKTLDSTPEAIQDGLAILAETRAHSGVHVQRKGSDVQMVTSPEAAPYIETFLGIRVSGRLSPAALETLAIVAYREPITRTQIEAIRGVNSDGVLGTLLARGMISETGRLETVGHPFLYSTTFQFLQQFGLKSTSELPPIEDKTEESTPNAQAVDETSARA